MRSYSHPCNHRLSTVVRLGIVIKNVHCTMLYRLLTIVVLLGALSCNGTASSKRVAGVTTPGKLQDSPAASTLAVAGNIVAVADSCPYYFHKGLKKNVYTKVEIEAEFPGGSGAKQRFISKNMTLLESDGEPDVLQSHASVHFVVDTDGSVKDIEVNGKSDTTNYIPLEKSLVRAIRSMPKWYPATCNGKPVASKSSQSMVVCFKEGE